MLDPKKALVRLNIAAQELGLAPKTVRKYCRCGHLKGLRLPSGQWRVYRASLDAVHHQQSDQAILARLSGLAEPRWTGK